MTLRSISGKDAIENLKNNPYATWPAREPADANRIEPYCQPGLSPSFHLEPGEMIFTIGSCFARNIERALVKRGFDVATQKLQLPEDVIDRNGGGLLNNFGVVSIENEFRWALDPDHPFDPASHILEVAPGKYIDPHLSVRPAALDKMIVYRSAVTDVTRLVRDCRVVIMTLGLSELWFDTLTQTYLNRAPLRSLVARHEGRFELHLLDFNDTMRSLNAVIALLRRYCRADQRILLTISPVPLGDTHTGQDVLVVNSYSKSVLRTAAEHIAVAHDHVDYFPSYESVTLSERARAWAADQVHVTLPLTDLNVERMLKAYMRSDEAPPLNVKQILSNARAEIAARDIESAGHLLEPLREASEIDPDFANDYVELCFTLGRGDDARAVLEKLPAETADWRRKTIEARIAIHDGHADEGVAMLNALIEERPRIPLLWRTIVDVYEQLERWDEALLAAQKWSDLLPDGPGPFRCAALIHIKRGDAAAAERAFREMAACPSVRDLQMLEFIEFLIAQKRFEDAARELEFVSPEKPTTVRQVERMKALLPSTRAP
jgi:tetratricopeptide (TPR) repeat protein